MHVIIYLANLINVSTSQQKEDTPLHLAARNGHLGAVQLLLDYFEVRNEVNHVCIEESKANHPNQRRVKHHKITVALNSFSDLYNKTTFASTQFNTY